MDYIEQNKTSIIELLKSTKRRGMGNVIKFLEESEFFTREGSKRHHYYQGGLAEHSLGVYKKAVVMNKSCDINSIIICALLHDVCKISHKYTPHECYNGHGSRSLKILSYLKLQLKDDEKRAIRFHASIKNRTFNDKDTEELNIAKTEKLRNLIARCVEIDVSPKLSFFFPITKTFYKIAALFAKIPSLFAKIPHLLSKKLMFRK